MTGPWRWIAVVVVLAAGAAGRFIATVPARVQARNRLVVDGAVTRFGTSGAWSPAGRMPPAPVWLGRRVAVLDLSVDPDRLWAWSVPGAPALVLIGAVLVGPPLALVLAGTVMASVAVAIGAAGDRAGRRVDRELPLLVDDLAGALRAGRSLPDAIRRRAGAGAGPLATDLRAVAAALDAGVPLQEALASWQAARPSPSVRLVVTALVLATGLGGGTAPLDGVATTLRDRRAIAQEVRAAAAQARASAVVLVATPFAFLALSAAYDPRALVFLTGTPIGLGCLSAGVALDLAGGAWMARTVGAAS